MKPMSQSNEPIMASERQKGKAVCDQQARVAIRRLAAGSQRTNIGSLGHLLIGSLPHWLIALVGVALTAVVGVGVGSVVMSDGVKGGR